MNATASAAASPASLAASASDAAPPAARIEGRLHARLGEFTLDTGPFCWPLDGITAIFGRSGCGKSTLLRAIAGLIPRLHGTLRVGASTWLDGTVQRPAPQRDIGYVFQDAALFPHLSVRGNLEFATRRAPGRPGDDALRQRAAQLGIAHLLDRRIAALSGGEKQRIAIARALLSGARLLLLDEPLAALDWHARDELLDLIARIARDQQLPMLLVSHAPEDVERLARRVVFMDAGRIVGVEPLQQALLQPDSPLFDRLGPVAVLEAPATALAEGLAQARFGDSLLTFPGSADGDATRLRIFARDVALSRTVPSGTSMLNHLPATVDAVAPSRPGHVLVRLRLGDGQGLWSEVTEPARAALHIQPGDALFALIKTASIEH